MEGQWPIDFSPGSKVLSNYLDWADVSMRAANIDKDTLPEGAHLALLNVNTDE